MISKVLGIVIISSFAFFAQIFAQEAEVPDLYCRDDTGKPVEWFIVYKVPRNGNRGYLNSGSNYTYVVGDVIGSTSNPGSERNNASSRRKRSVPLSVESRLLEIKTRKVDVEYWHTSQYPIESKRSMVGRTLAPLYAFPA